MEEKYVIAPDRALMRLTRLATGTSGNREAELIRVALLYLN
jgi:hypothetical protein